jgi:dihydrofolate reductase
MLKFVVSTTLKEPGWNNTTVLDSGDATPEVRKLKEEFDGEMQVPGSHRLVQELIENDLVDQINLMVFPVILGTGNKAFEETPRAAQPSPQGIEGRRRWCPRADLRAGGRSAES